MAAFKLYLCAMFLCALASSQRTAKYDVALSCRHCEYVLVSYCIGLGGHGVHSWTCPACKRYFPEVDSANVAVFKTGFLDYDIHAFVAYNPAVPEIIVAFEGTEVLSITNWLDDLDYTQIAYPLSDCGSNPHCRVHKGFYDTYKAIRAPLWETVAAFRKQWAAPIRITGHSMGSALATHCALDGVLNHNASYDFLYTFGTPRVGDAHFAAFYESKIANHFRVTHHKDPVPAIPETWQTEYGYRHIATEVYYENKPNGTHKICDGTGEDKTCRDRYGVDLLHVSDHLEYMGFDFVANSVECKV